MITNLYNDILADPSYNKIIGIGYLIVEYKCPIETEKFKLLTEENFIIYTISGEKDWIASGKIFKAQPGDALFVKKGVYTTTQYFDVDHCILILFISDGFIRDFMMDNHSFTVSTQASGMDDPIIPLHVSDTLKALFHSIFGYLKATPEIPRELLELKFRELLYNIVLNAQNKALTAYFCSLRHPGRNSLQHVMMNNYQHDLSLNDFARLSGRSLSSFKRDFKSLYNMPPAKWLTEKRLELAKNLLLHSDMNVNEVSFESGFKNPAHFNKIFRDKYALPPRQFRSRSGN
jgi:AraC-like DNA-binding protein